MPSTEFDAKGEGKAKPTRTGSRSRVRWSLVLAGLLAIACSLFALPSDPGSRSLPTAEDLESTSASSGPEAPAPTVDSGPQAGLRELSGIWSGCVTGTGDNATGPCEQPRGMFVTLYLDSQCSLGENCGSYVRGAFESEYNLMRVISTGTQGGRLLFEAQPTDEMFGDETIDLEVRMAGRVLVVSEAGGQRYRLGRGCDPVLVDNISFGCIEELR